MVRHKKLGIGVVGLGLIAQEHIRAFMAHPECKIVALCSRDKQRARSTADALGLPDCRPYDDFDAMLRQDDIDVVSICTPNSLHVEQGIAVAQAKKHLVMEKPIALDLDGARALEQAVAKAGIKSIVCLVGRWYPRFVNQVALYRSGAIGRVFFADCEYLHGHLERYPSQWRWTWQKAIAGNSLLQGGIHVIDAMLMFMESDPVEVTAYSHKHIEQYEYDPTVVGIVKFADGAVAKLTASFETAMPYEFNLRLYGTRGTIKNGELWSEKMLPGQNGWAHFPSVGADSGDPSHHPFGPMVEHFVDSILNDHAPCPDIPTALKSHEIACAAAMSAAEGRPIRLPL